MINYCSIDEVRDQVRVMNLEDQITDLNSGLTLTVTRLFNSRGLGAIVSNNGSSNLLRRTYVSETQSDYAPFPPDIDLNAVLYGRITPGTIEALKERLQEYNPKQKGEKEKIVLTFSCLDINVSLALYSLSNSQDGNVIFYDSNWMTESQRLDIRALKLILQRHGAYASYNRAIPGIAIDEMIRQFGSLEDSLEFLSVASSNKKLRVLDFNGFNLLINVSKHVWKRIQLMTMLYQAEKQVKSSSFEHEDWIAFNQATDQEEISLGIATTCSVPTCGREGHEIAKIVRTIADELKIKGFDYYVIPCQGGIVRPHTSIHLSMRRSDTFEAIVKEFKERVLASQK